MVEASDFSCDALHALTVKCAEDLELKSGVVYTVMRIALTSYNVTPGGSVEMADILGKEESIRRLKQALAWLN